MGQEKLFDLTSPKWRRVEKIIRKDGTFLPEFLSWWDGLELVDKFVFALGIVAKIRRVEYSLVGHFEEKQGQYFLVLRRGLKGSKRFRGLVEIQPFYKFVMENKELLEKLPNLFTGYKNIEDAADNYFATFKTQLGEEFSPRALEYCTVHILLYKWGMTPKEIAKVTGHEGHKNVASYDPQANFTIEGARKALNGNKELRLVLDTVLEGLNQLIEPILTQLDRIEDRLTQLEGLA